VESPFTFDELLSAWERVQENEGCAGADGVSVAQFARNFPARLRAALSLIERDAYLPFPLLRIVIEKRAGAAATRTLLVPSVRDRVLQTAAARQLSRSFEEEFLDCSYAYRPGRGVDRAIARIRELRDQGFTCLLEADIESFFDEVSHDRLLHDLGCHGVPPPLYPLLRQWIRAETWDGRQIARLTRGIPQGSPVSPILANFALSSLDLALEKSGCRLIRYSDDFLVLARTRPEAEQALAITTEALRALDLSLKSEKTRITDFAAGFHFLGVWFHDDDIWTPWKASRAMGRLVAMAHPLPAHARRRYELGEPRPTAMAEAFRRGWQDAPRPPEPEPAERSADMAFLYLTQQGARLRKSGDRLLVENDEEIVLDTPYHKLDHVLVFGNVQVTTQALGELLEKGVPVSLFSRQGNFRGAVVPPAGKNVLLRIHQFQAFADAGRALAIAREIVAVKIENGAAVLARLGARTGGPAPDFAAEAARARTASTVAELDGIEGAAARRYFDAAMAHNRSEFVWNGRNRHPPTDGLNALLSLAYTLLTHEASALLEGLGLDPCLGFLHQVDYGRPSLALDLVESFRQPVADRFVLQLVNRRVIGPEDVSKRQAGAGVFLKPPALIRFFECYEKWVLNRPPGQPSFRDRLHHAAEALLVALREGADYAPYRFDHEAEEECSTWSVTI